MPKSYKHPAAKRAHIPSKEEAGYENANPQVQEGETASYDKNPKNFQGNPVKHRGQDPQLWWMGKYGPDDEEDQLKVDIRSLYRHEHIAPEALIQGLYRMYREEPTEYTGDLFDQPNELFGNALDKDELEKISEYYQHSDGWSNRLIQGDSLLVMSSLLEREGMAGQVQTIYLDPPYGIKYNSNWQMKLNDRTVKDGKDEHLSGEPEMIKAFRDTWELGIHSYLSYLRDRLLVARELLTESGSCFVQISDENVHLVRSLMDEVFGSENFISLINFAKTSGLSSNFLYGICDYIIWYGKDKEQTKYRQLYNEKTAGDAGASKYNRIELPSGERRSLSKEEREGEVPLPNGAKFWVDDNLTSQGNPLLQFKYNGKKYSGTYKTNLEGLKRLGEKGRLYEAKSSLRYIRYIDDFPAVPINATWMDIGGIQSRSDSKVYVVQTANEAVKRCILMSSDPGDVVLDPTCGSGTTVYVAEQWGRRWITIDTSRIALNIAKTRLMTATFPYYHLHSDVKVEKSHTEQGKIKQKVSPKPEHEQEGDLRQGFVYEEVPHITLKSLANDEPPATETLYDKPLEDKRKLRVAGPFTVETLQNFEPVRPEEMAQLEADHQENEAFEERVFEHLRAAGVINGVKNEKARFIRVERLTSEILHAEGFYQDSQEQERKAYIHVGPKFGTVSRQSVNQAVKECRNRGDADWLIIMGFSFESDIKNQDVSMNVGNFVVTKVRMHDDLMQDGLLKKDKKAGSFVTIGEPDVRLIDAPPSVTPSGVEGPSQNFQQIEIAGLDIYDPIKDQVKSRDVQDIAYWTVDHRYDGSNFVVRQVFFCGGSKDEFKKWRQGLNQLAKENTRQKAQATLRIELDEEAFDRLYGFVSHPFPVAEGQQIAVRVVSQFGEESMKVMTV